MKEFFQPPLWEELLSFAVERMDDLRRMGWEPLSPDEDPVRAGDMLQALAMAEQLAADHLGLGESEAA